MFVLWRVRGAWKLVRLGTFFFLFFSKKRFQLKVGKVAFDLQSEFGALQRFEAGI